MVNSKQLGVSSEQPVEGGRQTGLKILMLTHRFYPDVGGIETNSEILATAFTDFGNEVHVLTWTRFEGKKQFPFTIIRDPDLYTLLREHTWADVVFENNPCLRLSWINIFIKRPLVIAVNTWVNRVKGNKGARDKLKNLWFRRAKYVIAVSEAIRKKEWPGAIVIENPYNDRLFKTLDQKEKTKPFIFLGRLVSDKGAKQALEAVSVLCKQGCIDQDKLQLTITGDGPERESLVQLREEFGLLGAVHFTGVLRGQQLVDCLNEHQYILVPSVWEEPYGNVVLEGLACGCVPIASNGGGMPEAVGKAGFLFKRNNMNDMVEVIKTVLDNRDKLEVVKREAPYHLSRHTFRLVSKRYFDILLRAVNK